MKEALIEMWPLHVALAIVGLVVGLIALLFGASPWWPFVLALAGPLGCVAGIGLLFGWDKLKDRIGIL